MGGLPAKPARGCWPAKPRHSSDTKEPGSSNTPLGLGPCPPANEGTTRGAKFQGAHRSRTRGDRRRPFRRPGEARRGPARPCRLGVGPRLPAGGRGPRPGRLRALLPESPARPVTGPYPRGMLGGYDKIRRAASSVIRSWGGFSPRKRHRDETGARTFGLSLLDIRGTQVFSIFCCETGNQANPRGV